MARINEPIGIESVATRAFPKKTMAATFSKVSRHASNLRYAGLRWLEEWNCGKGDDTEPNDNGRQLFFDSPSGLRFNPQNAEGDHIGAEREAISLIFV